MPLLKWGSWTPDTVDFEAQTPKTILNVVPRADGYGPFPSVSAYTQALPATCRGGFYALKSDGTVITFAATAGKLYRLNNTDFSWVDVSKGGATYSTLTGTAQWQFAQFGNLVFATQANAPLQVYDLSSSSAFADCAGTPPQAAYISVVGRFLVLSGLLSQPYRIQWSGLNATTTWTSGVNSSDFQDFPDGGIVRGVAGGEYGIIFQDQAIRRMSYVPGSPIIFQIDRIAQDKGIYAPYSLVRAGEQIFYYGTQGFAKIAPGGYPEPIGREKVDRTFGANLDKGNLQLCLGASDPRTSRVYWAYKSVSGQVGLYDTIIGYDYVLDQWFQVNDNGEYLLGISQTGLTLEALDNIAPGTIAITGAANNGVGLIRLAVASTATLTTNQIISINGVVGTTEANGENWKITVIDATHIDLQGSTFTNAYVSGGTIGGSLDAMTLSLDAYATAVQPEIAQLSSVHKLGFYRGPNLEATLESGEQGTDGNKIYINGFRPVTDAATVYGSASYRDTSNATATAGAEVLMNLRTGRCDMRRETRYSRLKVRIPAGTNWSYCVGVEPDVKGAGSQ
ncbi:hypothetical protein AYJ54_00740 [Bradyrhizobium centrolobii]|uniref:Uncharacterized protein n=1 Tax=Bradyrhizobium centrolobii TaxID=1505087 RepID=A0A176YHT0_9BRAD|nr:hypothetical protein [Bradyrhizobium centrolobii]OAF05465.1 hypothetical protein AYJ54_00740 [Bradyrhizobium centrolobii]